MSFNSSTLPFECNEDLWFEDGDIRVCALRSDSGVLCLYKLYRDILAAHSNILLNLLDISLVRRPICVGSTLYAYLADEDALDLERFFCAIYYPTYFLFWKHDARSFRRALPVFRIALKYKANDVIDALASQLEQDCPMSILEWDASQCEDASFLGDPCPGRSSMPEASLNRVAAMESASAIQIAHIANTPDILPAAYYQLSTMDRSDAWWQATISRSDPTKARKREKGKSKREPCGGKFDRQALLSKEDLHRLALGKEELSRHMLNFKKRLPNQLVLHPKCVDAWNMGVLLESDDVLTDLLEVCSGKVFLGGVNMCLECRSRVNDKGREERERVWDLLPKFFCLPVRPGSS